MAKQAPIVRLPPKSTAEIMLGRAAQVAAVLVGVVAFVFTLHAAEYILAPSFLGIVVGLMFGPLATRLEARGLPPAISALLMTLLFILCVGLFALAVAAPLSFWVERLPRIWSDLQAQLWQLKAPLDAIKHMRDQLRELTGNNGVAVSVDEGVGFESMAALAPAIIGQILIFLASLYFFIATRDQTRIAILRLCLNRRLRWRVAHIFRDVEQLVSRYLLSITVINVCEGLAVGVALVLIGIPSAPLWGAIAIVTNFVVFIGPMVMVAILFAVGLTQFDSLLGSLLPVAIYLGINMIEAQFVTPLVIGRTMTLNPFVVLLALVFWIWLWGPLGGFVAIPALLIVYAAIRNIIPGFHWGVESTGK